MREQKKIRALRRQLLRIPLKDHEKLLTNVYWLPPVVISKLCDNDHFVKRVATTSRAHPEVKAKLRAMGEQLTPLARKAIGK